MAGAVPDDFWVEWHPSAAVSAIVITAEWVRIPNAIRELSCSHGFEREVGRVEAGSAIIVFDDRDRSLDPSNPYAPNRGGYTPLRHMRIRARAGATEYTIWRGFTVDWTPGWQQNDGWVILEGRDSLLEAARRIKENTLSTAIAALSPDIWLPLDDGGTALAQSRAALNQPATMTSTKSTGNLLPFSDQPSTTFPFPGRSKGDVIPFNPGPLQVNGAGFTIAAVMATTRPEAQIIFSAGPDPAVDATVPNGDVQLTADAGETYSLRVGNAAGASLGQLSRPRADPSTLIVARYNPTNTTLWASLGYNGIGGLVLANAGIGGTFAPRAGVIRVGAGMEAANNNPFLGSLSHVAQWNRHLTDAEARGLFYGYFGSVRNTFDLGPSRADHVVTWVLDRLGVPVDKRNINAATLTMGGTANDMTALEMMSRAANTEGGYFFANRSGQFVLRMRGAVGSFRGNYDTRPTDEAVMSPNDRGLETSAAGWTPSVAPAVAASASIAKRSTARAASGVASLAITRQLATVGTAGATLRRSQWSEVQSSLSDGTLGPWVPRSTATITNPGTAGRDGDGYLRIQATGAGGAKADAEGARSATAPGVPCFATGYVRALSVSRTARLYWEFFDAAGALISTVVGGSGVPPTVADSWQQIAVSVEPPIGARFRRLGVEIIGPTVAGEAWQVDDVSDGLVGFPARTGQVLNVSAKVSASVAGKTASVGAVFLFGAGFPKATAAVPLVGPPTVGFAEVSGQITIPASPDDPVQFFAPYVAVDSLGPGETVWFDDINVRPAPAAALADMALTEDDRTFATVARLDVTTAADPQVVEFRHANAAVYGVGVVYDPPTTFATIDDAKAAATLALGDGTPELGVVTAEVAMGAPGVDAGVLLASDILDQVVTVGRIPGPIGWRFTAIDEFTPPSAASLGSTDSGAGADIVAWTTHGANTWGQDANGAFRNVVGGGHEQATIPTGAADHSVSALLFPAAGDPIGVVARWVDPSNHLLLEWTPALASAVAFTVVGGVRTSVGTFAGASGDRWGLSVAGDKVTILRNDVAVGFTTTTNLGGTRVGLNATNATGTLSRAKSFRAGATDLALAPHLQKGTILKVGHAYDRAGTWRTRWGLVAAD